MRTLYVAAAVVFVAVATAICLLFGTIGWFVVGFGVMTDCTNNYSCSTTSCSPCATTELWINAGALAQQLLAAAGIVVLVRGLRTSQIGLLASSGVFLLVSSPLIILGTTWLAQGSYCQPGSPGYVSSYCSTDD